MELDLNLQHAVLAELEQDPDVEAAHVGVSVADGLLTLTGTVPCYAEKIAAERAARRVPGVRAVVEAVTVQLPSDRAYGDADIARRIVETLDEVAALPARRLSAQVERGGVTLSGTLDYHFQREQALKSITHVHGITSITDCIEVHNPVCAEDVADGIAGAFRLVAALDMAAIRVATDGSKVVLSGIVASRHEADVARKAAWAVPGVTALEDQLHIAE